MEGRPGIFFGVELGALASLGVLLFTFRHETQPISATVETEVTDTVPSALMLLTVGLLIAASFLPQPAGGLPLALYGLRSGLICAGVCLFGILRACLRRRSFAPFRLAARELDIGTCILGIFDADAAGRLLELEGQRAACLIAMGYPEQWKNGPGRKETEELLSFR